MSMHVKTRRSKVAGWLGAWAYSSSLQATSVTILDGIEIELLKKSLPTLEDRLTALFTRGRRSSAEAM